MGICYVMSANIAAIALSLEESGKQTKSLYPSVSNTASTSLQQHELRKVLIVQWCLLPKPTDIATVCCQFVGHGVVTELNYFIDITVLCNTFSTHDNKHTDLFWWHVPGWPRLVGGCLQVLEIAEQCSQRWDTVPSTHPKLSQHWRQQNCDNTDIDLTNVNVSVHCMW